MRQGDSGPCTPWRPTCSNEGSTPKEVIVRAGDSVGGRIGRDKVWSACHKREAQWPCILACLHMPAWPHRDWVAPWWPCWWWPYLGAPRAPCLATVTRIVTGPETRVTCPHQAAEHRGLACSAHWPNQTQVIRNSRFPHPVAPAQHQHNRAPPPVKPGSAVWRGCACVMSSHARQGVAQTIGVNSKALSPVPATVTRAWPVILTVLTTVPPRETAVAAAMKSAPPARCACAGNASVMRSPAADAVKAACAKRGG